LVLLLWTSSGFAQVYAASAFWVWTAQTLALWLLVPLVLLTGRPWHLAHQLYGTRSHVARILHSAPCRALANPLVGPALVPILSLLLFFGPVGRWAIAYDAAGIALQLVLVVVGLLMLLPFVDIDESPSSLTIGLALAIGMFEVALATVPGIALRLSTTLRTDYFDARARHSWSLAPLHDQQLGGQIVWAVAALGTLPFLLLMLRRWAEVDEQEAASVDAVLDAERIARGVLAPDQDAGDEPARDAPWWLSDPGMRERFRRQG
jgi:cytochrome c oxidase assembly factor CtaG